MFYTQANLLPPILCAYRITDERVCRQTRFLPVR